MTKKIYANEHPKNKKKGQDKNVKVAKVWTIGGKTYTSKQFKALSPSEQKNLIDLMGYEYEQSAYDKLGIK